MKNFFSKHRHLIVISLIIAVILAALTPLVVPLGLELDEKLSVTYRPRVHAIVYQGARVTCRQHDGKGCSASYTKQALGELCRIINRAPEKREEPGITGNELCTISLLKKPDARSPATSFTLSKWSGRYRLSTRKGYRSLSWSVSDETAQRLLSYCWCAEEPAPDNPRRMLTDPALLKSVQLERYEDGEVAETLHLSPAQIEAVCARLEELLELVHAGSTTYTGAVPHLGTVSNWTFTTKDGQTLCLRYRHDGVSLSIYNPARTKYIQKVATYEQTHYTLPRDVDPAILNAALET